MSPMSPQWRQRTIVSQHFQAGPWLVITHLKPRSAPQSTESQNCSLWCFARCNRRTFSAFDFKTNKVKLFSDEWGKSAHLSQRGGTKQPKPTSRKSCWAVPPASLLWGEKNPKTIPSHLNIYSKLPEWSPTSSESNRPTNSTNVSLCGVEVRLCYCFHPLRPGDNRLATSGNGILSGGHDVQVEKQVGPAGQRDYTDVIVTTPWHLQ